LTGTVPPERGDGPPPPLSFEGDNVTNAQRGADPAAEAGKAGRSTAPEPDKLTTAQQGADPEAEAASGPQAAEEADEQAEEERAEEPVVGERVDEEPEEAAPEEAAPEEAAPEEPRAEEAEEAEEAAADAPAAIAADLDAVRAEAEGYLDDLRRLQADFDNYRKRTLREQTARAASASQALVARLLPVLDNFELAVSHAEQSRDFDRMLKGVEMVFGELREVLQGEGLVKIEAEGKPFDPERHEAVIAVDQEGAEPGTVVDVVRAGYELRGRVLRPAMVKVAK
jgi:molecular chaperone GrpE